MMPSKHLNTEKSGQLALVFDALKRKWGNRKAAVLSWTSPFWVFLVFFCVIFVQHRYVYLYHDDYGYASLSYAYITPSVQGHNYTLPQLVEFLVEHYNHWGGRILLFGIEILVLRWGVWPYRIVQSIVLTMILVSAYGFVCRYYRHTVSRWLIAFTLCCCYGLIDLELHRNGTYWATAAVGMVWPFLGFFSAAFIHVRLEDEKRVGWQLPILGILYFMVGFSQEQIGILGLIFVGGLTLAHLYHKKNRPVIFIDMLAIVFILVGYSFLVLAPGNFARLNSANYAPYMALNLVDKVRVNLPSLIAYNLGRQNQAIVLVWVWLCVASMWVCYRSGKQPRQLYFLSFAICAFFGIILTVVMISALSQFKDWIYHSNLNINFLLFWIGFLGANCMAVILFIREKGHYTLLALFVGGLFSQLVMLISPSLSIRSSIIFLFTLFPILAFMMAEITTGIRLQILAKLALLMIFTAAMFNTILIIRGYAVNSPIMESNDRILRHMAQAIRNGTEIEKIELSKLPRKRYAADMPYSENFEYIDVWIKEYYDLPPEIKLIWR